MQEQLFATEEDFTSLDDCIDHVREENGELFSLLNLVRGQQEPPKKKRKLNDLKPIVFVRFNTRHGKPKPVTLKALLDSGASSSLVTAQYAKKLRKAKSNNVVWTTPAGELTTSGKCKAQFTLPELHDNRLIEYDLHITPNMGAYDMILGRDILSDLKINLQFSDNTVVWDQSSIPMKDPHSVEQEVYHIDDPASVNEATERLKSILDAKYEKADLQKIADDALYLTEEERGKLHALLEQYETLFDGTLGQWSGPDYEVELREDATPYHAKAYPIPRVHTETLKMEVE